jgi:hypothetical protein
MSGTSPQRWSPERKLAYGKYLVDGMREGAETGERFARIFLTRLHVMSFFDDAVAPEAPEFTGGFGFKPTAFHLSSDDIAEARAEMEALWVVYVQAAWPDHVQTPGSAKWIEVEERKGKHESQVNPFAPWQKAPGAA